MSNTPENEFDLEKLFLPAWAQEPSASRTYAQYEGQEEARTERRPERRGPPRKRMGGPPGGRRDESPSRGERGRSQKGRGFGDRPADAERRGPKEGLGARPWREGRDRRERREPPPPLPQINVTLIPDEKGVESLARQIKMTGRAYPLFEIAQMILQKPERHAVSFSIQKNAEGQPIQPLFVCALDDSLWLSEAEAIAHVLKKHFGTFYQAERTPTEPPKGKYTFVAQCGLSDVILGPPNYHDYQNQLRKLHTERFSRMPFEVYKSRVRIVRDEQVVKKWIDEQSFRTEYICLNMPEPLRLGSMEAVEQHFREHHKDNIIKPVETHLLSGTAARALRSPPLLRLVRQVWEDQRRFPLQIATVLSQQFASHGLQFFKVNKTITHVSVARPHYLDLEATPVSEGVKKIVDYVNANPKCTRRKLLESLNLPQPPPATAPGEPQPEPTPEQTAIIADLHWLIHQGHVIEFANGTLETAKKPLPRPPKPEAKSQPDAGAVPAAETSPSAVADPQASPPEAERPMEEVAVIEPGQVPPATSLASEVSKHEFQRAGDHPAESEPSLGEPHPAETSPAPAEASVTHHE